jgi:L-lactate utilization protein LutB
MDTEKIQVSHHEDSPYPFIAKLITNSGTFYGIGESKEDAEKYAKEIAQKHQERLTHSKSA